MSNTPRVAVCTPVSGVPPWDLVGAMLRLYETTPFTYLTAGSYSRPLPIHTARNELATAALSLGCEVIVMLDGDAIPHPRCLLRLLDSPFDITSTLAFSRSRPHHPVAYLREPDGRLRSRSGEVAQYVATHDELLTSTGGPALVREVTQDRLLEAEAVGMHCCAIRSDVFRRVPTPWFRSDRPSGEGEDTDFCQRAREVGCSVAMDLSILTDHVAAFHSISPQYFIEGVVAQMATRSQVPPDR